MTITDTFANRCDQDVAGRGVVCERQRRAHMGSVVAGRIDGDGFVVKDTFRLEVIEPAVGSIFNFFMADLTPAIGI